MSRLEFTQLLFGRVAGAWLTKRYLPPFNILKRDVSKRLMVVSKYSGNIIQNGPENPSLIAENLMVS